MATNDHGKGYFGSTTSWSKIHRAQDGDARSIDDLFKRYWKPIFKMCREGTKNDEDAEDLAQAYCVDFIKKALLQELDKERGTLRSYICRTLTNFLSNQRDYAGAQKRGGGVTTVSLDATDEDGNALIVESGDVREHDKRFDIRWANEVIGHAKERLKEELSKRTLRNHRTEKLMEYLVDKGNRGAVARAAADVDMTERAFSVALHRARKRFGELIRKEVGETLPRANKAEIDEEVRYLQRILVGD